MKEDSPMDVRNANLVRKRLSCLRCSRLFWTDRCHRVCARCHRLRRTHGLWDLLAELYGLEGPADGKGKPKSRLPGIRMQPPRRGRG